VAVVPSSHEFVGGIATTSEANTYIRDPIQFLLAPPIAELRQTSAQSLTTSTWTSITFGAEDADTDVDGVGGHDNVTNNSRFTARYAGWYEVAGGVAFAFHATGVRATRLAVNGSVLTGTQVLLQAVTSGSLYTAVPVRKKLVYLNVGDYVEVQGFQSSGGALNTEIGSEAQSTMSLSWKSN
jgi:hypothetical protein